MRREVSVAVVDMRDRDMYHYYCVFGFSEW